MKYLYIILIGSFLAGCSPTPDNEKREVLPPPRAEQTISADTAAIIAKFVQHFTPEHTAHLTVTKIVTGAETEKYELLAEMQSIREKIHTWNEQIKDCAFHFDTPFIGSTWEADIQDHADAAIHINELMLKYDEIVERLLEGDYHGSGTFYEAHDGKSAYWLIEDAEGKTTLKLKRP